MILNIHSPFSHIYRNFYDTTKLPNDLCSYFWKLIFALVCLPLIWPVFLININSITYDKNNKCYKGDNKSPIILGVLLNLLIFLTGMAYSTAYYGKNLTQYLSVLDVYTNGIITLIIFALCILLIVKIINYFILKNKKVLTDEEYRDLYLKSEAKTRLKESKKLKSFWYITWTYLKSMKDNYCPVITWDNNKDK